MKVLALFGLILMSAVSSAIPDGGTPVGPGAPTQTSRPDYFIKANAHKVKCMAGYTSGADMTEFVISIEGGFTITIRNNEIGKLYRQCEAALHQSRFDGGVTNILINIDTGEVFPSKGFFIRRQFNELERQQVQ